MATDDPEPEFHLDNDRLRSFVSLVRETAEEQETIPELLGALHDPFRELLLDDEWLPELYRNSPPPEYDDKGEMGGDIAQWLLYRLGNKLSLFTLVIPPGVETPVHDHLAWGLVGLYQGTQREEFYRRVDDGGHVGPAELEHVETREQGRGDFYELVPPDGDIHGVRTTSDVPSVSVHLLGTDVGCIQRHQFDAEDGFAELFQSHYTNVRCDTEKAAGASEGIGGHGHAH